MDNSNAMRRTVMVYQPSGRGELELEGPVRSKYATDHHELRDGTGKEVGRSLLFFGYSVRYVTTTTACLAVV